MSFGLWEILALIVLVLLLFGAGKLPGVMKDVAGGVKAFKKGLKEDETPDAEKGEEKPQ